MRPVRVVLCISLGLLAVWISPLLSAQAPMPSNAQPMAIETPLAPVTVFLPIVRMVYPVLPAMPDLRPIDNSDHDDAFLVQWLPALWATSYELQEDDQVEFSSPDSIYSGPDTSSSRSAQTAGVHFYRVRGINDLGAGPWSQVQRVWVGPWGTWVIQNDTGADLTFDVYGYQKRTFPTGPSEWEMPAGTYSFRVSARCGSLERTVTIPPYDRTSTYRYYCRQPEDQPPEGSEPSRGWVLGVARQE